LNSNPTAARTCEIMSGRGKGGVPMRVPTHPNSAHKCLLEACVATGKYIQGHAQADRPKYLFLHILSKNNDFYNDNCDLSDGDDEDKSVFAVIRCKVDEYGEVQEGIEVLISPEEEYSGASLMLESCDRDLFHAGCIFLTTEEDDDAVTQMCEGNPGQVWNATLLQF
jgi:hypothetical protein